jgi:hypothetical protein
VNELLLWISGVGSGSEAAFRRRAMELVPPRRTGPNAYSRALWSLDSLAHCEFGDAAGGGWRVAPPVIAAGDPAGAVSGVLCGARSASLVARLSAAAGEGMSVVAQRDAPDLILLSMPAAGDLMRLSRESGIPLQWNAPLAILSAFAPPPLASFAESAVPSGGWAVERFSVSKTAWLQSSVAEADRVRRGLFRFRSEYAARHIYRQGAVTRDVPPGLAKYWALGRRQRAMCLDLSRGQVSFPLAARPPGLIDRALVVASGTLPIPSDGRLTYTGITAPVAAAAAAALRAIAMGADS